MPKISVIMSVYNAEKYLQESVQSILNQTLGDFEFIIVDDGSTDASEKIIKSFSDPRIKILEQENKGLTKSLNRAIRESTGEYIARMDADDISFPKRFEKQISFLEAHPDIVMCGTQCDAYSVPCSHADIKKMMFFHNPFVHPSVMIRSSILKKNLYNESFRYMQDYELWSRIVPFYKTENLSEILVQYGKNESGITASKKNSLLYVFYRLHIRFLCALRLLQSVFSKPRRN